MQEMLTKGVLALALLSACRPEPNTPETLLDSGARADEVMDGRATPLMFAFDPTDGPSLGFIQWFGGVQRERKHPPRAFALPPKSLASEWIRRSLL
jgi:hypothetical protein